MRMALAALLVAASCSSVDVPPPDGGELPDAGGLPDAGCEHPGPLGTCLSVCASGKPRCSDDSDCGFGVCAMDGNDCRSCAPRCGGRCLSASDCCGGESCRRSDDPPSCGICRNVEDECGDDRPCEPGSVCGERQAPPCSCSGGTFRTCVPDCRLEPCASDESCGSDFACAPISCTTGFPCPPEAECVAGSGVPHDCVPRSCGPNLPCPGTSLCVAGRCSAETGRCELPRP